MTQLLQALINGLSLAAVYGLIGLGFVIIYKSTQVFNFAQPALLLLGAYWVVYFATVVEWPFWLAVIFAAGMSAITGIVVERVALRPMVGKPVFAVAIMTIGLNILMTIFALDLLGIDARPMGAPWGIDFFALDAFGGRLVVTHRQIAAVVAAALLVGLLLAFFKFSRFGLAMRATAFDQEVALTQGVSVTAVFAASWAIASVLAMVGGVFIGSVPPGLDRSASIIALKALPVVVIGGLDSVAGALVGALIVGLAEALASIYQPQYAEFLGGNFSQVVPYLVMFLVLLVKPYGLFGTKEVERV